jgi:hypothetical protein
LDTDLQEDSDGSITSESSVLIPLQRGVQVQILSDFGQSLCHSCGRKAIIQKITGAFCVLKLMDGEIRGCLICYVKPLFNEYNEQFIGWEQKTATLVVADECDPCL